jgi:2-polyprenyl-3-methyl-5-hydroxy-6-metoxy-1,4-benzoquinol methylase
MTLETQRLKAAEASRGISSGPSYELARRLLEKLAPARHVLEFGAGTGNFARRLAAEGFAQKISCADILPRPVDLPQGVEWIAADLNNPLPVGDGVFDGIVSTEVIEHLENPRAVFREFRRVLRPGGWLVLTTPNQESLRSIASLVLGRHFAAFLGASYPAHITAVLELDFTRICAETGFEPPLFYYTNTGRIPKMTRFRWPAFFCGRWFSDNLALETRLSPSVLNP